MGCQPAPKQTEDAKPLYDYDVEERLTQLGIELEEIQLPPGLSIELAVRQGDLIYLSGNGPKLSNGKQIAGKVGEDLTLEEGYEAARLTAINHLSVLKSEISDLNKVVKVIKDLAAEGGDFEIIQFWVNAPAAKKMDAPSYQPLQPKDTPVTRSEDGKARIDLVATLRAAAPWQPLRQRERPTHRGLHIRPSDIRLKRTEERSNRLVIFCVDASGSAALARLGEATAS